MAKRDKLFERILSLPTDFTFHELQTLLGGLGYEMSNKGKAAGSRVIFVSEEGKPIRLHRPHNGILKEYQLEQIISSLRENEDL